MKQWFKKFRTNTAVWFLVEEDRGLIEEALTYASDTWAEVAIDPELQRNEDDQKVAAWARRSSIRAEEMRKAFGSKK
jgi:hypothetical protein